MSRVKTSREPDAIRAIRPLSDTSVLLAGGGRITEISDHTADAGYSYRLGFKGLELWESRDDGQKWSRVVTPAGSAGPHPLTTNGYPEREVYRDRTPLGDDVWTEIDHPQAPSGWKLRRVTTYSLVCANCGRTRYGLANMDAQSLGRIHCDHCG